MDINFEKLWDEYLKSGIVKNKENYEFPLVFNFYGCSFNLAKESAAESRYNDGGEIFNRGKEE